MDAYFADRPELRLHSAAAEKKVRNGASLRFPEAGDGEYRVYGLDGQFLMLGRVEQGMLSTIKNFFEV